jgi:hypothetical protein
MTNLRSFTVVERVANSQKERLVAVLEMIVIAFIWQKRVLHNYGKKFRK